MGSCGVRACLLEASSEKPGNVSPKRGFADTSYGDFLRGSRALGPVLREAALRGFGAGVGEISLGGVGVGFLVKEAVNAVRKSHSGGNTHLGVSMLLVPLAAAAGLCASSGEGFAGLRLCLKKIVSATTVEDSLDLYDAINMANPGGLGESALDVRDGSSKEKIRRRGLTFIRLMGYSAGRDMVARELSLGMPVVFGFVVPNLERNLKKTKNQKKAITQTFLQTLAKHPDTLIARKTNPKKSRQITETAAKVLEAGGVYTKKGKAEIKEFDGQLRTQGNKLNPGTTADLITAALYIHLLRNH